MLGLFLFGVPTINVICQLSVGFVVSSHEYVSVVVVIAVELSNITVSVIAIFSSGVVLFSIIWITHQSVARTDPVYASYIAWYTDSFCASVELSVIVQVAISDNHVSAHVL